MNKFRERFTELLKESTKKQCEIAKELNITKSHLSNFKSGYNEPNIDTLILIANYFNVCIDYLVGRQDYY